MADGLQRRRIADLGHVITGRTPVGTKPEFFGDYIPFLTPTDMDGRRMIGATARSLSVKGANSLKHVVIEHGIAVSCIGWQMGKAILVDRPVITNQQINSVVTNPDLFDDLYLYYSLTNRRDEIFRLGAGGTRTPILNKSSFERIFVDIPPLSIQRAVATLLGGLDDKIELNRRMNETLEAMARAIFKDWFVDFGPVRTKQEGRAPYLAPDIWSLFPDRLDDEGKPEGARYGTVSEIGDVVCGKTPPTHILEYFGQDIPFITIPDMHGKIFALQASKKLTILGADSQPKKNLPPGSICVSCIATPGLVVITTEASQTNQQINSVIPLNSGEIYYWFWVLKGLGEEIRQGRSGGSVLSNLSTRRFTSLKVLFASEGLREEYHSRVKSLFDRILANERESATLAAIRDLLLPKLMSGEIRVKDAEKLVGQAA